MQFGQQAVDIAQDVLHLPRVGGPGDVALTLAHCRALRRVGRKVDSAAQVRHDPISIGKLDHAPHVGEEHAVAAPEGLALPANTSGVATQSRAGARSFIGPETTDRAHPMAS